MLIEWLLAIVGVPYEDIRYQRVDYVLTEDPKRKIKAEPTD